MCGDAVPGCSGRTGNDIGCDVRRCAPLVYMRVETGEGVSETYGS